MERSLRSSKTFSPLGYGIMAAGLAALSVGTNINDPEILTEYAENTERANAAGVEVWLSYKGDRLQLPVAPFYDIPKSWGNQRVVLYEVGEVNVKGKEGLKSTQLSSFFPHLGHEYYFVQYPYSTDPYDSCKKIETWANEDEPIKLTITGTGIDLPVLIDSFTFGESESTRDVHFTISLSEYRYLEVGEQGGMQDESLGTTVANARPGSESQLEKWEITYGDQLTGIASAVYGDPDQYTKILELNDWIDNPDSLKAHEGEVLRLV